MLFGEARNCSELEKIAIAHTAINRAKDNKKWNGTTVKESILKPGQYTCFNKNDPNRQKLLDPRKYDASSFEKCLEISRGVLSGGHKDPTNGATHYHTSAVNPSWAKKMRPLGRIKTPKEPSKHFFYREN